MKTWKNVKEDPRVQLAYADEDGAWIELNIGFADLSFDPLSPTHTIHEWNDEGDNDEAKRAAMRRFYSDVRPCTCKDCVKKETSNKQLALDLIETAQNYLSWQDETGFEYYCFYNNGVFEFGKQALPLMLKFPCPQDLATSLINMVRGMIGKESIQEIYHSINARQYE